jgi:pimeloyl-ACP methyl ester carboxylesterase
MKQTNLKNQTYTGSNGRLSLVDLTIPNHFNGKLILFIHGYMGYKDWGCWNLVENFYTELGFGFCKFNMTHNGGTVDQPIDFTDLDAFGENNYSKEVYDVQQILSWLETKFDKLPEIFLIGHSRGGGIALLTSHDERITKVSTWAAICDIEKRFPEGTPLKVWKTQGKRFIENSRTGQKMPNHYSQYEDFEQNREQLNIEEACKKSTKTTFVVHGDLDESVEIEESRNIANWLKTRVFEIEDAGHTFGATQPWTLDEMPEHLQKVCEITLGFFLIDSTL